MMGCVLTMGLVGLWGGMSGMRRGSLVGCGLDFLSGVGGGLIWCDVVQSYD
jgi:hypothetical protein